MNTKEFKKAIKLLTDEKGISEDIIPSFTVIIKIIFTNIDKFNVFLNLLHFLLVVLSGMWYNIYRIYRK